MSPIQPTRDEIEAVVEMTVREATALLAALDTRAVRQPNAESAADSFQAPLPETGVGAESALRELIDRGLDAAVSSRRARSLAVWATLRAYGRDGYRALVERHLALARRMAARVDDAPDLERMADVKINIVCFRYNPGGRNDEELDRINERLGQAILEDGRVYAGTTRHEGRVALRSAIANWRTRETDIDTFVAVVRELGARVYATD